LVDVGGKQERFGKAQTPAHARYGAAFKKLAE
jgi:hypothetical protein